MKSAFKAAVIAVVVSGLQLGYALIVASKPFFYGSTPAQHVIFDIAIYSHYAARTFGGAVPYRDFAVEYPPLALPFFMLPRLFASDFATYHRAFAVEMFAANAVALALVVRWVGREGGRGDVVRRVGWYTIALALLCPVAVCRFDLLVMAWAFASAHALATGRPALGGVLAGSGVLLKVVPGVVILSCLARGEGRERSPRARAVLGFLAALAVGMAVWALVGGKGVAQVALYHANRGVEVESLYAGVLMAVARARGAPIAVTSLYRGVEVETAWSAAVGAMSLPILAATLLVTAWRAWRAGCDEPLRYAGAAVLAFVAFGKVLSPQYLIWPIPFLACTRGRTGTRGRLIFLAACAATTLIFPVGFDSLLRLKAWAIVLVNVRNALLVGLWALLTFGPRAPDAGR